MTTIAALVTPDGRTFLAGDRQTTDSNGRKWPNHSAKIEQRTAAVRLTAAGEQARAVSGVSRPLEASYAIAFAGPAYLRHWVRERHDSPQLPDPADDTDCTRWAYTIGEAINEGVTEARGTVADLDAHLLLAYAGRVWRLLPEELYCARIPSDANGWAYTAIGSGGEYATGALAAYIDHHTTPHGCDFDSSPAQILRRAVAIASDFDAGSGGGLDVFEV